MDLQQMKSYFKSQNESKNLTKQVRDTIKQNTWQKQDAREGFTETFTPLIQSQESIKKSIDEQQNATIEQLRANQLALTDKENKLDQLLKSMLAITDAGDDTAGADATATADDATGADDAGAGKKQLTKVITPDYFDKYLSNDKTQKVLLEYNFDKNPSSFYNSDIKYIYDILKNVSNEMNNLKKNYLENTVNIQASTEGYYEAIPKNKKPQKKTLLAINSYNELAKYFYQLNQLYKFKKDIKGSGMTFYSNPLQLLDRLELLGASINAGNNGVIPEFSQIVHYLYNMSIITRKQLNVLLKNYVLNR